MGVFSPAGFSPDGDLLLVFRDQQVQVWETLGGDVKHSFRPTGPGESLGNQAAWGGDGKTFVTFDLEPRDPTRDSCQLVQVWNIGLLRNSAGPSLPQRRIQQVAFSRDGKKILTSGGCSSKVWSLPEGKLLGLPLPCPATGRRFQLSPEGDRVLSVAGQDVRCWPIGNGSIDRAAAITCWAQFATGMELIRKPGGPELADDEWAVRPLEPAENEARRQNFEHLAGLADPKGSTTPRSGARPNS
jgi:WD40 repeat protein